MPCGVIGLWNYDEARSNEYQRYVECAECGGREVDMASEMLSCRDAVMHKQYLVHDN